MGFELFYNKNYLKPKNARIETEYMNAIPYIN